MNKSYPIIAPENRGLEFLQKMKKDPLNFFVNLTEKSDSYTWIRMPGQNVLFMCDAEGIKHVLQTNHENYWKGKYNQVLKPIFGKGIFLAEKEKWREQRRLSAPVFSGKNFPDMTNHMIRSAELMFDRLDEKCNNNEPVDLGLEMMWYALDVVLRALYHSRKDNIAYDVSESLIVLLDEAEKRIWSFVNLPQNIVLKLPPYKKARDFFIQIVDEIIEAKKTKPEYPEDLLSVFIKKYADGPEGRSTLYDQVMSFLLAGHETTANGLLWTFYELGKRPEFKKLAMEETDHVMGNEVPTFEKIKHLHVSKRIYYETLRLYPPVWSMSRQSIATDTISLENGETVVVPPDTTVMMCTYAMHRNTKYWEHPEAFIPDRFLNVQRFSQFSFFPFGGGPRVCLGARFAETESLIMMSMLLQRYDFTLIPGQRIEPLPAIALKSNKPIYFRLKKRKSTLAEYSVKFLEPQAVCPMHAH